MFCSRDGWGLSRRWVQLNWLRELGHWKMALLLLGIVLDSPWDWICVGGGIVLFCMGIVEWLAREQR